MIDIEKLKSLVLPPTPEDKSWYSNAHEAFDYIMAMLNQDVILYAGVGNFYCYGKLGKGKQIDQEFPDELTLDMSPDAGWCIDFDGKKFLMPAPEDKNEEQLVFRRYFESVESESRIEVSQRFLQRLNLFWLDNRNAYCLLNENGDIEPVIHRHEVQQGTSRYTVVTISRAHLDRYMAITDTVLVSQFEFMRTAGDFSHWFSEIKQQSTNDISVQLRKQHDASLCEGSFIVRPAVTKKQLIAQKKKRQYAKFKSWDWKNKKQSTISCAPGATVNYFTKNSDLPWEVTPAFFKPEVLAKYKADSEKYELLHRSITCRGTWYLKTYDVNEANQVHTYLVYLRDLPYEEQLYWQSFNEWPKASISQRAYQTDILGSFSTIADPLIDIKRQIRALDEQELDWWQSRPSDLANTVHYPFSASKSEWAESILNLSQLLNEGFQVGGLRARLTKAGVTFEDDWRSLKLLAELAKSNSDEQAASKLLKPLRELQELRSKVKGHAAGSDKKKLIDAALRDHGSLYKHFENLAAGCSTALEQIVAMLSAPVP